MNDFSMANYEFFYACWAIPPAMENIAFSSLHKKTDYGLKSLQAVVLPII